MDIWDLIADLRQYVCRNVGVEVLACDCPGEFIGWASLEGVGGRTWTISVEAFNQTLFLREGEGIRAMLETGPGRRCLIPYFREFRLNRYEVLRHEA